MDRIIQPSRMNAVTNYTLDIIQKFIEGSLGEMPRDLYTNRILLHVDVDDTNEKILITNSFYFEFDCKDRHWKVVRKRNRSLRSTCKDTAPNADADLCDYFSPFVSSEEIVGR